MRSGVRRLCGGDSCSLIIAGNPSKELKRRAAKHTRGRIRMGEYERHVTPDGSASATWF